MSAQAIEVAGETLLLLPERAIYWVRAKTMFIADTHFGKTATFRAHAIPLPEGSMEADLERLSRALDRVSAEKLVILGDLLHSGAGRDAFTMEAFAGWRQDHTALAIDLVRGNHDRSAGDPPSDWQIRVLDELVSDGVFVLSHKPVMPEQGYAMSGHIHPAIQLVGKGRQMLKLPCFWFGARYAVLPAFGSFTSGALIQPEIGDSVFAVTESSVVKIQ